MSDNYSDCQVTTKYVAYTNRYIGLIHIGLDHK